MAEPFVIVTDSTTDLPQQTADELGLVIIPYLFNLDGKEYFNYLDHRELPITEFYARIHAGKTASTSLVTAERYKAVFEPIVKSGRDVLYLCLSTGLSSSYSQSLLAARELEALYPQRRLVMIDTLAASLGQGMLAYYAAKARDEGRTLQGTASYIHSILLKQCMWVGVDDLYHLRRGGRVSGASAFVGTLLNIKPVIHVDDAGHLIPVQKIRGWSNVIDHIVRKMEETITEPKNQVVFISHADAQERAERMQDALLNRLGKRDILINPIGPVIGAHTGPGTLAVFFQGSKR